MATIAKFDEIVKIGGSTQLGEEDLNNDHMFFS